MPLSKLCYGNRVYLMLALVFGLGITPAIHAQIDFSQQLMSTFSDTSTGSVGGISFTTARSGGRYYNVKRVRRYTPGNLSSTRARNYPTSPLPDQLEIARTGNAVAVHTFQFASNLPNGTYLYLQDNDNNEVTKIAFLDASGNRIAANDTNNFVIYNLSTSGLPSVSRTVDSITFTGVGSAVNEPLVAVRIKTTQVRRIAVSLSRFVTTNTLQVYFSVTATTLPVQLHYLKVQTSPTCEQDFHWKIAQEPDIASCWLEYLDDRYGVQMLSGELDAKGNSGVYHWDSRDQRAGMYRVAIRRDNGLIEYSAWTWLRLDCGNALPAPSFIVVNPVGSELVCTLKHLKKAHMQVICTGNGQVVYEGELLEGNHKISAEQWVSGLYQIKLVDPAGTVTLHQTFVKL